MKKKFQKYYIKNNIYTYIQKKNKKYKMNKKCLI